VQGRHGIEGTGCLSIQCPSTVE